MNDHSGSKLSKSFAKFLSHAGPVGLQILNHDWSESPLGAISTWPVLLKSTLQMALSSRQPIGFYWGPDLIQFHNEAYVPMLGERATEGIGAPFFGFWKEIAEDLRPYVEQALSGQGTWVENLPLTLTRNGTTEETFWTFSYSPLFNTDESIAGIINIVTETTKVVRADIIQHNALVHMVDMFQQAPSFMAILREPEHRIEAVNVAFKTLVGRSDVLGLTVKEVFPASALESVRKGLDEAYKSGKPYRSTSERYALQAEVDGHVQEKYVDVVYQPITNLNGQVNGILVQGFEVTEHKAAGLALRASESFLRGILDSSRDCVKVLDLDGGLVYMTEGGKHVMEVDDFEIIKGCPWPDFWKDDGNVAAITAIENAKHGKSGRFEGYADTMRGNPRYWDVQVTPIFGEDGKTERILAVSRDISSLKDSEMQRAELMREMSHRLKNSLTLVQAIVSQTFQHAKSMDAARDAVAGRIAALGRSQDILIATESASSNIEKLIAVVLAPHRDAADRFHLSGPDVTLSQKQALGLSLALHELATNATKYGALSTTEGRVNIDWSLSPDLAFDLSWMESGGPAVDVPTRKGFGSRLIERMVAAYFNGKTELAFAPSGVVFTLNGRMAAAENAGGNTKHT